MTSFHDQLYALGFKVSVSGKTDRPWTLAANQATVPQLKEAELHPVIAPFIEGAPYDAKTLLYDLSSTMSEKLGSLTLAWLQQEHQKSDDHLHNAVAQLDIDTKAPFLLFRGTEPRSSCYVIDMETGEWVLDSTRVFTVDEYLVLCSHDEWEFKSVTRRLAKYDVEKLLSMMTNKDPRERKTKVKEEWTHRFTHWKNQACLFHPLNTLNEDELDAFSHIRKRWWSLVLDAPKIQQKEIKERFSVTQAEGVRAKTRLVGLLFDVDDRCWKEFTDGLVTVKSDTKKITRQTTKATPSTSSVAPRTVTPPPPLPLELSTPTRDFVAEWGLDAKALVPFDAQWSSEMLLKNEPSVPTSFKSAIQLPRLVKLVNPEQANETIAVAILWWIDRGHYPYIPHIEPPNYQWYHTGGEDESELGELISTPQRVCFFFTMLYVKPERSHHHSLVGQMFSSFQFLNRFFGISDGVDALTRWCLYGTTKLLPLRTILVDRESLDSHVIQCYEFFDDYQYAEFPRTVNRLSKRDMLASMCRWECDEFRCRVEPGTPCTHQYRHNYSVADEAFKLMATMKPPKKSKLPAKARNRFKPKPTQSDNETRAVNKIEQGLPTAWANAITFSDTTDNTTLFDWMQQGYLFQPLLKMLTRLYLRTTQHVIPFPFHYWGHQQNATLIKSTQDMAEWWQAYQIERHPVLGLSKYLTRDGSQCVLTGWRLRPNPCRPSPYSGFANVAYVPVPVSLLDFLWKGLTTATMFLDGEVALTRATAEKYLVKLSDDDEERAQLVVQLGFADDALYDGANSEVLYAQQHAKLIDHEKLAIEAAE